MFRSFTTKVFNFYARIESWRKALLGTFAHTGQLVRNARLHMFTRFTISESHGAPVHASGEKHPVRLGNQLPVEVRVLLVGTLHDGVK
jgi:hypothetical protein